MAELDTEYNPNQHDEQSDVLIDIEVTRSGLNILIALFLTASICCFSLVTIAVLVTGEVLR